MKPRKKVKKMSELPIKGFIKRKWNQVVEKGWDIQRRIEEWTKRFGKRKYGRVIKLARKPTYEEFVKTSAIAGIGIILIGLIGYVVYLLYKYIPSWLGF